MDRFYLLYDHGLAAIDSPVIESNGWEPLVLDDGTVVSTPDSSVYTVTFETHAALPMEFETPPVIVDMESQTMAIRLVDAFCLICSDTEGPHCYSYLIRVPERYTVLDYPMYRAMVLYRLFNEKQKLVATGYPEVSFLTGARTWNPEEILNFDEEIVFEPVTDPITFSSTPAKPGPFWEAYQQGCESPGPDYDPYRRFPGRGGYDHIPPCQAEYFDGSFHEDLD